MRVLDETSINVALTRRYGWAPTQERCYGTAPHNWGKNVSVLTSLTTEGIDVAHTISFEGGLTRPIFEHYIVNVLGPQLAAGDILILDNLSAHKSAIVEQVLAQKGCTVLFLPAYSPDFSPIELAFAKVKAYLRAVGARTREALTQGLEQALEAITPSDALAFFKHCGYPVPAQ